MANNLTPNNNQAFTVLLCALGGEGGGVLADWLVNTARACGHAVQGTSIPGVAQRTGATTYYIEIFPRPSSALAGRKPVFGLYAVPGEVDLLVGSELLEVVRQAAAGMVSPDRTAVIASTRRTLTTAEKMPLGDGRFDNQQLSTLLHQTAHDVELFDMVEMAQRCGTVTSAIMFGAIGAWLLTHNRLPFPRAAYEATIRAGGLGVEASLRGFAAAWDHVAGDHARRASLLDLAAQVASSLAPSASRVPAEVSQHFPAAAHQIIALGLARVVEYQDTAYGTLYLQRLQRIWQAERSHAEQSRAEQSHAEQSRAEQSHADQSQAEQSHTAHAAAAAAATTIEAARWLALWMAFDDIVRVAELKCRASRFARVRAEVKALDGELVRIFDHFKPGIPEIAALLPSALALRLQRWDRARVTRGKEPFGLPIALGTHTLFGFMLLRLLASMKGQRRRGQRFGLEQALIERWIDGVEQGQRGDAALGLALARCGRLIKGYGATNERGKDNLLHVVGHLALDTGLGSAAQRAAMIDAARQAALADDAGLALDQVLHTHGVAARPVKEQPIRFVRAARSSRQTA